MRTMILLAVLGLTSAAFAGPSDHMGRRFGDYSATERPEMQKSRAARQTPYALTGETRQHRVLVYRDVFKGRGQVDRQAYWTWVTE